MKHLVSALNAEFLKLKRNLGVLMIIVSPLTINFLYFMIMINNGNGFYTNDGQSWHTMFYNVMVMWSILMLPLLITLQTSLLGNLEHSNNQWKHLFALSIPRSSLYLAKWIVIMLMMAASVLVLLIGCIATGLFFRYFDPSMGFDTAIPFMHFLRNGALNFAAAFLIISIHTFIGIRSRSFVFSIAVGMIATVASVVVMAAPETKLYFYPWVYPMISFAGKLINTNIIFSFSIGGGIMVTLLGILNFSRMEIKA